MNPTDATAEDVVTIRSRDFLYTRARDEFGGLYFVDIFIS